MSQSRYAVVMPTYITERWQLIMTLAAVETLRATTDEPFTLIVPNRVGNFEQELTEFLADDHVIGIPNSDSRSVNHDTNLGFRLAAEEGHEFVIYTGNDVFTRPRWLDGLVECFKHDPRCGIATLMPSENRSLLHNPRGIQEGVYGPFMMFRAGWEFDADEFPGVFGDTDFVVRHYREGFRAYRNNEHTIYHFLHQTAIFGPEAYQAALARFRARHDGCGLVVQRMLAQGGMF